MNEEVIIVGDFNFNLLENNSYNTKLLNIIHSVGMKQIIDRPTRVTKTSRSLVDLLIINQSTIYGEVYSKPKITDHDIISIHLLTNKIKKFKLIVK